MTDTVTIPREEYDRLLSIAADAQDIRDADRVMAAIARGDEELIPAEFANRLIDGENPIKVYRELRGLSGTALAEKSGVNRVQLLDIEHGRKHGSVETLWKIATALDVKIDDIADLSGLFVVAKRPGSSDSREREVLFITKDRSEAVKWIVSHLQTGGYHAQAENDAYDSEQDIWRSTSLDGQRWRFSIE